MIEFDKAFDDFLDRPEYDKAEADLFSIIRLSFKAGWEAAGGAPLKPVPVAKLLPRPDKKEE